MQQQKAEEILRGKLFLFIVAFLRISLSIELRELVLQVCWWGGAEISSARFSLQ